jgi:transcription antitermination factor NusG
MKSHSENDAGIAEPKWFALRVRPRHEKVLSSTLHEKGYEVFLPLYRASHRWSDRLKEVELPLFPGYLFCRFALYERYPIISVPGVLHIVGIGRQPVAIRDSELESVQRLVNSGRQLLPWPCMYAGQEIVIERGPFKGVEGILLSVKNVPRLVVSVTLLQRAVSVELDSHWVRPSRQSRHFQVNTESVVVRQIL